MVLRLLRGESLDTVSRAVGVELYRLAAWQARALVGLELGLKEQAGASLAAELDTAKRHMGELSMENELLRERARAAEVATMSATTSATTGRRSGLKRVCRTWERSRSALYARRARAQCRKRGDGPARQGDPKAHDGTIVTSAPQVMWGTDGVRVFTVEDGWIWTFAAVEPLERRVRGLTCVHGGEPFCPALEPIAQGLGRRYGSVEADVARGLALRMDHGSQYLSDHFLNQIRYWGIHPSFGFLEEPETNGVVERGNRTLKEQAI